MLVVDYCRYNTTYRKRTSLWTEMSWIPARPLCRYDCAATCMSAANRKRHASFAQQGKREGYNLRHTVDQLHAIPAALCDEIAEYVNNSGSIVLVLD